MDDLVQRLQDASSGQDEWRVKDPASGSYCIAFDYNISSNPEREAREWIADHRRNGYRHSHYEVACVRVYSQDDKLMQEAAARIERLTAEVAQLRAEWQPIETAPKDGTAVLLAGCRKQVVAAWVEHDIEWWHVDDNKHGPWPLRGPAPTHWMPLPPPPGQPIGAPIAPEHQAELQALSDDAVRLHGEMVANDARYRYLLAHAQYVHETAWFAGVSTEKVNGCDIFSTSELHALLNAEIDKRIARGAMKDTP